MSLPETKRPDRRFLAVPLLLAVLALSGCFVAETQLTLKPDGSGTIDLEYSVDEDTSIQLKGILALRQAVATDSDPTHVPNAVDRWIDLLVMPSENNLESDIVPLLVPALTLSKSQVSAYEGRRKVRFTLAFTNIEDLTSMEIATHMGLQWRKTANGNLCLERIKRDAPAAWVIFTNQPAYLDKVRPVFSGLTVRVMIETPAPILTTSGTRINTNKAEWNYSFDKNPLDLLHLQTDAIGVVFDGRDLPLSGQ